MALIDAVGLFLGFWVFFAERWRGLIWAYLPTDRQRTGIKLIKIIF